MNVEHNIKRTSLSERIPPPIDTSFTHSFRKLKLFTYGNSALTFYMENFIMFGINTAIRSVATGVSASVDSTARTIVGSLSLAEKAIERRLADDVQKAKTLAFKSEVYKDIHETAKSCGFASVDDMKSKVTDFFDNL